MSSRAALATLVGVFVALVATFSHAEPPAAAQYKRLVIREAHAGCDGLQARIAVYAGQIEQESGWDPNAKSAYASGLAQFTPQTAAWISGAYRKDLGSGSPSSPAWAVRALVRYDCILNAGVAGAADDCSRWAFALSGYNGGAGWIGRDRKLCAAAGCNPAIWFGMTENFTARSAAAARENRGYPRRILKTTQWHYAAWGSTVACSSS